jgi:RHS repeat-associated protein
MNSFNPLVRQMQNICLTLNDTQFPLADANGDQKSAKPKPKAKGDRDFEAVRKHGARCSQHRSVNCYCVSFIDEAGNVQAHYTYDAFGNTVSQTGAMADDFPFRFSNKYLDDETGLYYYGYRYLSPALGRWLSRDPVKKLEQYVFNLNNSINYFDILGLEPFIVVFGPYEVDKETMKRHAGDEDDDVDATFGLFDKIDELPLEYATVDCSENKKKLIPIGAGSSMATYQIFILEGKGNVMTRSGLRNTRQHENNHLANSVEFLRKWDDEVESLANKCVCPECLTRMITYLSSVKSYLGSNKIANNHQLECDDYPIGEKQQGYCDSAAGWKKIADRRKQGVETARQWMEKYCK